MANIKPDGKPVLNAEDLEFLDLDQVRMIDEALSSVENYGEVRLVLENHRLRFIICQVSFDAFAYEPGKIRNHGHDGQDGR